MVTSPNSRIETRNFSKAFEQLCNFVAVAKTGDAIETVKGLVCICLVVTDDCYDSERQFAETIDTLFGIGLPSTDIRAALDDLLKQNVLSQPENTNYRLATETRASLLASIDEARTLEETVKTKWLADIAKAYPDLPLDKAWLTLRSYLARAFRRHGMQTVSLLDPTLATAAMHEDSLSHLLANAIAENYEQPDRELARQIVSDFFATVGNDTERAQYVAQAADAAFSFYKLQVPQDVSAQLATDLQPLTIFLDTNFLFGILDIHNSPQVQVSLELLESVRDNALPFRLRYHEATEVEMKETIRLYGGFLRSQHWPQRVSRAATASRDLSGIELKFHELNADGRVDVDEFLRRLEHFDVSLGQHDIAIFRTKDDRVEERASLHNAYSAFLANKGRDPKPYEVIDHDATVLDTARQLRNESPSTLAAGAIIITCDYFFYLFDHETALKDGTLPCVILPNMFWQILRPYVRIDQDFDIAFAETFAIPEFRALGGGANRACSKMLGILAAYEDMPEETATALLTNGVLLDRLRGITDDDEFADYVKSAIVEQNVALMEERAALAKQVAHQREQQQVLESTHGAALEESEREKTDLAKDVAGMKDEIRELQQSGETRNTRVNDATKANQKLTADLAAAQQKLAEEGDARQTAEKKGLALGVILSFLAPALVICLVEVFLSIRPWSWLNDHENCVALHAGFIALTFSISFGLFLPRLRKLAWAAGGISLLCVIISLL